MWPKLKEFYVLEGKEGSTIFTAEHLCVTRGLPVRPEPAGRRGDLGCAVWSASVRLFVSAELNMLHQCVACSEPSNLSHLPVSLH